MNSFLEDIIGLKVNDSKIVELNRSFFEKHLNIKLINELLKIKKYYKTLFYMEHFEESKNIITNIKNKISDKDLKELDESVYEIIKNREEYNKHLSIYIKDTRLRELYVNYILFVFWKEYEMLRILLEELKRGLYNIKDNVNLIKVYLYEDVNKIININLYQLITLHLKELKEKDIILEEYKESADIIKEIYSFIDNLHKKEQRESYNKLLIKYNLLKKKSHEKATLKTKKPFNYIYKQIPLNGYDLGIHSFEILNKNLILLNKDLDKEYIK